MREQIIETFANDKTYIDACKRIDYTCWKDLYQETCIAICVMPEDKLIKAYKDGYFKGVVIRTILNIRNNKSRPKSPLFMSCNNTIEFDLAQDEIQQFNDLESLLNSKLVKDEKEKFYESRLMRAYIKYGSYRKLSKACDIPYNTIQNTLKGYMEEIRKDFQKEING